MRWRSIVFMCVPTALVCVTGICPAAEPIVRVGSGSYSTLLPDGAKAPPEKIQRTENVKGPMPTNDWWSSLAWMKFSERHYPHPLAVETGPSGLRVYYPGTSITANQSGIFAAMPAKTGDDLILGHSEQAAFTEALLDGFSDWFVSVRFSTEKKRMITSYGHGSPFVFARYEGGNPRITFSNAPKVWFGNENSPVLGVTVNGKHYGLFGPGSSTWQGLNSKVLMNLSPTKHYFSLAILPDASEKTISLFKQYAYSHVTDTRVAWSYDAKKSEVATTYSFSTTAHEGDKKGTLFALYPHQWRNAGVLNVHGVYPSVRGKMQLIEGESLHTRMRYPGVLPALPNVGGVDKETMAVYLKMEVDAADPPVKDTYWDGKRLGKIATAASMAEQVRLDEPARRLHERSRKRLEEWFTASKSDGASKNRGLFHYDERWGTLIGYPASYGSDVELNDHHFHYGYFIMAAAAIARVDPSWAKDECWGGMVKLLIRDIASGDRADARFPFLRNFDPYAGHSWASGHAKFGDGNNHESSSEAMNAWTGLILWGEATGDRTLRDLGIYLYTTEMHAIEEYWFDVHGDNFPKGYTPAVATLLWGGKGANATWFSADPAMVHGINFLPIQGGSLYLGRYPAYVEKNYSALVKENGGAKFKTWADILWMYRALVDPRDALEQFKAVDDKFVFEEGNSKAATYHWIGNLARLGQVDASVSADTPLYAVFRRGKTRTYVAYNMTQRPLHIVFSDGFVLKSQGKGYSVEAVEK